LDALAFCKLELQPMIEHCQKLRLQGCNSFRSAYLVISTTFVNRSKANIARSATQIKSESWFRHLAILLNQDELQLTQNLHSYILSETILLDRATTTNFDQLPKNNKLLSLILCSSS